MYKTLFGKRRFRNFKRSFWKFTNFERWDENVKDWREKEFKEISEENLNVNWISLSNINNVNNNENIGFFKSFEASGEECIKKFSLNTEQETTFKLFTYFNNANQRIVYCGGEGDTGKSQIINAIADCFDNNNMKNRLFIGAFTETAALNIRGNTLHKFLSMTRQKNKNNKNQII